MRQMRWISQAVLLFWNSRFLLGLSLRFLGIPGRCLESNFTGSWYRLIKSHTRIDILFTPSGLNHQHLSIKSIFHLLLFVFPYFTRHAEASGLNSFANTSERHSGWYQHRNWLLDVFRKRQCEKSCACWRICKNISPELRNVGMWSAVVRLSKKFSLFMFV